MKVAFSADGARAFAVTQDGISVVDLLGGASPTATQNFAIGAGSSRSTGAPDAAAQPPNEAGRRGGRRRRRGVRGRGRRAPRFRGGHRHAGSAGRATAEDVSITPDGAYALVRRDGDTDITVALAQGRNADDRLAADGADRSDAVARGDFALAVMRDTSTVAVLPIPGIATAPASFTTIPIAGETVGRALVTKSGKTALLFTTVAAGRAR